MVNGTLGPSRDLRIVNRSLVSRQHADCLKLGLGRSTGCVLSPQIIRACDTRSLANRVPAGYKESPYFSVLCGAPMSFCSMRPHRMWPYATTNFALPSIYRQPPIRLQKDPQRNRRKSLGNGDGRRGTTCAWSPRPIMISVKKSTSALSPRPVALNGPEVAVHHPQVRRNISNWMDIYLG
jgi:hypothetical protein